MVMIVPAFVSKFRAEVSRARASPEQKQSSDLRQFKALVPDPILSDVSDLKHVTSDEDQYENESTTDSLMSNPVSEVDSCSDDEGSSGTATCIDDECFARTKGKSEGASAMRSAMMAAKVDPNIKDDCKDTAAETAVGQQTHANHRMSSLSSVEESRTRTATLQFQAGGEENGTDPVSEREANVEERPVQIQRRMKFLGEDNTFCLSTQLVLTMLELPNPDEFMLDGDSIDDESSNDETDWESESFWITPSEASTAMLSSENPAGDTEWEAGDSSESD